MKKGAKVNRTKVILNRVLQDIQPKKGELEAINKAVKEFILLLRKELKKQKIASETFIGGSLAKGTLLKRDRYDVDIFVRFNYRRYSSEEDRLSRTLEKILRKVFLKFRGMKENSKYRFRKVHGSRDYFQVDFYNKRIRLPILLEIIPVLAVNKPSKARNVTDLSFFHVNYIKKQIIGKKGISNDILLAKSFCYANNCYGAESHIRGLSGYALEVLVVYYGSFLKFTNAVVLWEDSFKLGRKIIIDPARKYRKTADVLLELNESKLISPIVVIDPTYPIRNISAAVSPETFKRLIEACRRFRRKPSMECFKKQEVDIKKLRETARRKKAWFCVIEARTNKTKEDIAASKSLKFFNFLVYLLEKNDFKIILKEIKFEKQKSSLFLIYKKPPAKAKVLIEGPPAKLTEHVNKFKKKYKKTFSRQGKVCAYEKRKIKDIKDLIDYLRKTNPLKDMSITGLRLVR